MCAADMHYLSSHDLAVNLMSWYVISMHHHNNLIMTREVILSSPELYNNFHLNVSSIQMYTSMATIILHYIFHQQTNQSCPVEVFSSVQPYIKCRSSIWISLVTKHRQHNETGYERSYFTLYPWCIKITWYEIQPVHIIFVINLYMYIYIHMYVWYECV